MTQVPGESGIPVLFPSTVWRRSPTQVVQVPHPSGAGPIFPIGPAPLESTEATSAVQDPSIKTDLRQMSGGLAPQEGRPAPGRELGAGRRSGRPGPALGATPGESRKGTEGSGGQRRGAAEAPLHRGLHNGGPQHTGTEASGLGAYTGTEGSGGQQHTGTEGCNTEGHGGR